MRPPRLGSVAVALTLVVASTARGRDRADDVPIRLDAGCHGSRVMLTIRNASREDTAIIFGVVIGKDPKYLVSELTLRVARPDGRTNEYGYMPSDYPNVIGGRLDDWIVPLPAGFSYVMPVTAPQFRVRGMGQRLSVWPTPARLTWRLALRGPNPTPNSDMLGLKFFKVWHDADALTSNDIALPDQCR